MYDKRAGLIGRVLTGALTSRPTRMAHAYGQWEDGARWRQYQGRIRHATFLIRRLFFPKLAAS